MTSDWGTRSEVLLEVEVPVVSNKQCNTSMDGRLCAGGEPGKDACKVEIIDGL